jgi:hypothetical protein
LHHFTKNYRYKMNNLKIFQNSPETFETFLHALQKCLHHSDYIIEHFQAKQNTPETCKYSFFSLQQIPFLDSSTHNFKSLSEFSKSAKVTIIITLMQNRSAAGSISECGSPKHSQLLPSPLPGRCPKKNKLIKIFPISKNKSKKRIKTCCIINIHSF